MPAGDVGRASGVSNTLQRFGAAFGIALVTTVFAANGHLGSVASFTAGYRPAMAVSAGISLPGAAAAVAVGHKRPVPAATAPASVPVPAAKSRGAGDVPAAMNSGARRAVESWHDDDS